MGTTLYEPNLTVSSNFTRSTMNMMNNNNDDNNGGDPGNMAAIIAMNNMAGTNMNNAANINNMRMQTMSAADYRLY